jgi:hypothetical protein
MWIVAIAGAVPGIALLWLVRDFGVWYLDDSLVPAACGLLAALGFGVVKLRSHRLAWALVVSFVLAAVLLLVYFAVVEWLVLFAIISTPVVLARVYSHLLQSIQSALWRIPLATILALTSSFMVATLLFSIGPDWSPFPVAGAFAAAAASAIAWEILLSRRASGVDGHLLTPQAAAQPAHQADAHEVVVS